MYSAVKGAAHLVARTNQSPRGESDVIADLSHPPLRIGRRATAIAVCLVGLSGCAVNPIAQWTPPLSEGESPISLAYARKYADAARSGYQKAIIDQVQMSADLNSGLLGLGALATALAVSTVHRDAVIGTAFIGGTAYAFGQLNLSKQRLLIYQAGVDAIGCAKRAVVPLAMTKGDVDNLDSSLQSLELAIQKTVNARAVASAALLAWNATGPRTKEESNAAQASLTAAASAVEGANRSLTSGRQLLTRARQIGDQLVNAVDRIDAAVVRATLDTLPDPSSVFKVIQGLAGFSGAIVPGAGTFISDALSKRGKSFTPQGGTVGAAGKSNEREAAYLAKAVLDLNTATEELAAAAAKVNGRLLSQEALMSADALKDCGVTDVSFPLKAMPENVSVPGGADVKTSFLVSGGTPPYIAKLQYTPTTGVSVQQPNPFDSTVGVDISKEAAKDQSIPVLVMDSSKPTKSLVVQVEVGAGTPPKPDVEGEGVTGAAAVARAINDKKQFKHPDTELTVSTRAEAKSESEITVGLRCKPKPPKCIARTAAAKTISSSLDASLSKYTSAIQATGAAECICAKVAPPK